MPGENGVIKTAARLTFHLRCLLVLCGPIVVLPVAAEDFAFVCENNGQSRSVEVVAESGYACRVKYGKAGGTTFPWSARNDAGYCGSKALYLVDKLKSWGWQCDSAEDVKSVLGAHIERYHRHIKILSNVGKTCNFYPGEVQYGNLCGDDRKEGVIVYTCEAGAENWDQHLAVFLEIESEPLILEVGDSRSRQVTDYHVDNRRLLMETQRFDKDAPAALLQPVSIGCRSDTGSNWELYEK